MAPNDSSKSLFFSLTPLSMVILSTINQIVPALCLPHMVDLQFYAPLRLGVHMYLH